MGGGKETPRQKMVGLMYLVLMALLAMNVSKEIINAFVTLNNKLEGSIEQVLHLMNWLESNSIKIQTILLFHLQGICVTILSKEIYFF